MTQGFGVPNLLITDPRAYRNASPAHAACEATHVVALSPRPVLHGDGTGAAAVKGRAQHADGAVAVADARTLEFKAIGVELIRGGAEVAIGLCLFEG